MPSTTYLNNMFSCSASWTHTPERGKPWQYLVHFVVPQPSPPPQPEPAPWPIVRKRIAPLVHSVEPMVWLSLSPTTSVRPASLGGSALSLDAAIERSRFILELQANWDEEGAVGYAEDTWTRAVTFLRELFALGGGYGWALEVPAISPSDAGGIDLFWKGHERTLLINVPARIEEKATYYGQNSAGTESIRGIVSGAYQRVDLAAWLGLGN